MVKTYIETSILRNPNLRSTFLEVKRGRPWENGPAAVVEVPRAVARNKLAAREGVGHLSFFICHFIRGEIFA